MPLSAADKTALQADVQKLSDDVTALVVDPNPNPVQVRLDAALALIADLAADANARKADDAAKVEGQNVLDKIAQAGF